MENPLKVGTPKNQISKCAKRIAIVNGQENKTETLEIFTFVSLNLLDLTIAVETKQLNVLMKIEVVKTNVDFLNKPKSD